MIDLGAGKSTYFLELVSPDGLMIYSNDNPKITERLTGSLNGDLMAGMVQAINMFGIEIFNSGVTDIAKMVVEENQGRLALRLGEGYRFVKSPVTVIKSGKEPRKDTAIFLYYSHMGLANEFEKINSISSKIELKGATLNIPNVLVKELELVTGKTIITTTFERANIQKIKLIGENYDNTMLILGLVDAISGFFSEINFSDENFDNCAVFGDLEYFLPILPAISIFIKSLDEKQINNICNQFKIEQAGENCATRMLKVLNLPFLRQIYKKQVHEKKAGIEPVTDDFRDFIMKISPSVYEYVIGSKRVEPLSFLREIEVKTIINKNVQIAYSNNNERIRSIMNDVKTRADAAIRNRGMHYSNTAAEYFKKKEEQNKIILKSIEELREEEKQD